MPLFVVRYLPTREQRHLNAFLLSCLPPSLLGSVQVRVHVHTHRRATSFFLCLFPFLSCASSSRLFPPQVAGFPDTSFTPLRREVVHAPRGAALSIADALSRAISSSIGHQCRCLNTETSMQALMPSTMISAMCIGALLVSVLSFALISQNYGRVFCRGVVGHTRQASPHECAARHTLLMLVTKMKRHALETAQAANE